ncbi:MAG: DUF4249 domain-containing protein [Flavitalea sp.]
MNKILCLLVLVTAIGCKDRYKLPVDVPSTGYLVVDGTINAGSGSTSITLSRTSRLVDTFNINYVKDATVTVEGEDNSVMSLYYTGELGQYENPQLTLNPAVKYRLRIQSSEGKEYLSSYLNVQKSPPIDNLVWDRDDAGVNVYADAHGTAETSGFYRWDYRETWEYHSAFVPNLKLNQVPLAEYIFPNQMGDASKFYCWSNANSTRIEILSTAKLAVDTAHYSVIKIPRASAKLSVLYSALIRQYAISKECFEYLARMKKNTEQTGSLFDAQPSELKGNITCTTDPNEPVIGFIEITETFSKRIFIRNSEVPGWGYSLGCLQQSVLNHPDSIAGGGVPTIPDIISPSGDIVRAFMTSLDCVDCTARGGSTTKPDFWP